MLPNKAAQLPARCQPRTTRDLRSSSPLDLRPGPGQTSPSFSACRMIRTVRGAIIKLQRSPPYQVIVSWARAGCRTALLEMASFRNDNVLHWGFWFPFLTHGHGWPAAELVAATVSLLGMFVTLSLPEIKGKSLE